MQAGDVLLGKFRIERVLGRGGMGLVVAVRHVELDELFAMKLMHPETLTNLEAIERFVREARAAARLKGEHVARVHDVGRLENGAPYMLMEHLVGDDLSQLLDKRGALSVRDAALYVLQACEAIAEAHGHGIVHRDLKPANLFLTERANGTPCIKVLDFGISKKIDPAAKFGPALTVTGAFMGSPAFMSPEQMLNGKTVDTRSDIWALGAILYELTTGALPFTGETMTELVARVMDEPATPPSTLRPDIPHAFDGIVLTCLQKRAARRYQSIGELIAALRPFANGDNIPLMNAIAAPGLARIDDSGDSERATRVARPQANRAVPVSGVSHSEKGPDSNAPTLVVKPVPKVRDNPTLPTTVPTEIQATNEDTVEMTTQLHRALTAPRITPASAHSARSSRASRISRILVPAVGILGALGIVAYVRAYESDSSSLVAVTKPQSPSASATPEAPAEPIEVQPALSASANTHTAPVTSSSAAARAGISAPSSPPSVTIERPASTAKQSLRKIKPTLY